MIRRLLVTFVALVVIVRVSSAQTEQTRETWQRVPELFAAAHAVAGVTIADIGAGEGFLTVRLSLAVGPTGRVYAIDVDPAVVNKLRARVAAADLQNVSVLVGAANDPRLPAGALDGVIILNAYHEIQEGQAELRTHFSLIVAERPPRTTQ